MAAIFLIAAAVSVLQWTAVSYASSGPFAFNLQLVTLVFFSVRRGFKTGLFLGIFFGIFNGLFGISAFWANVLIYGAIGLATGYAARWFYRENFFTFILMVVLAEAALYFFNPAGSSARTFLPVLIYTAAASVFLFYFFKAVKT